MEIRHCEKIHTHLESTPYPPYPKGDTRTLTPSGRAIQASFMPSIAWYTKPSEHEPYIVWDRSHDGTPVGSETPHEDPSISAFTTIYRLFHQSMRCVRSYSTSIFRCNNGYVVTIFSAWCRAAWLFDRGVSPNFLACCATIGAAFLGPNLVWFSGSPRFLMHKNMGKATPFANSFEISPPPSKSSLCVLSLISKIVFRMR